MRYPSKSVAIALLAAGISGCNLFSGGEPDLPDGLTEPVTPESVQDQTQQPDPATQPADGTGDQPGQGEPFDDPVVEGENTTVGNVPLDLIPSTDPDARAAEVTRQRSDPFALVPTTPVVEIPVSDLEEGELDEGGLAPIPDLVPTRPGQPTQPIAPPPPPPPPVPELARAVVVTGVVQLGNVPYAIVDAPNEPHSRYVREGQLLSNGEVLVKRININPGGEPIVIFEQFGIEVATAVGAGGDTEETTPDAEAAAAIATVPRAINR